MELSHNSGRIVERFGEREPRIGRLGRLIEAFRSYLAPSALSLSILCWLGCWMGRRAYTTFRAQRIYPATFVFLIGPSTTCDVACGIVDVLSKDFGEPVLRVHTGIRNPQSLVYTVRDGLIRPEKQHTRPNEPARYSRVPVDGGEDERRVLIHQTTLAGILRRKATNAGASLVEPLHACFRGRDLAWFMTLRDGGFLRSSAPHICILSVCSAADAAGITPNMRDLCFFADGSGEPFFGGLEPERIKDFNVLLPECYIAAAQTAGEIPLAQGALRFLEDAVRLFPPSARSVAATKIIKLALPWAVLDSCRHIDESHLVAATEIVKDSDRALNHCQVLKDEARVEVAASRIEEALKRSPAELTGSQLSRLFSGNLEQGVLKSAKNLLLKQRRASVTYIPTDGRPLEVWRIGDLR
jgi:hypothetical protein